MSTKNKNGDLKYVDIASPDPVRSNPTHDFLRAIDAASHGNGPLGSELPSIFPSSAQSVQEKDVSSIDGELKESGPPSLTVSGDFTAKYARYNMDDPEDIDALEKVTDHFLKDGWLPAREEWVHTRDGGTFVILKYLVRNKPPKKDGDDAMKSFGFGR